ncbi:hypothetical protein AX17_006704 [Amanita inopinata Kibby_2008]|nr:hypothetical protein AX17_006704 [Amanita inopinata Kibby_2008]
MEYLFEVLLLLCFQWCWIHSTIFTFSVWALPHKTTSERLLFRHRMVDSEIICGTYFGTQKDMTLAEQEFRQLRMEKTRLHNGERSIMSRQSWNTSFDVDWHVIYSNETYEGGYISDGDIEKQMRVLNAGYANVGMSWNLVNVSRVHQPDWFMNIGVDIFGPLEYRMKMALRQGDVTTLNIYTVSFYNTAGTFYAGITGYATLPKDYIFHPDLDGVVMSFAVLPGGSNADYHLGHSLIHEAGHWLGLYHTFQGGCTEPGDQVDDTPPQKHPTSGCPSFSDTCGNGELDAIDNYMDYSSDDCRVKFTPGQITRMIQQAQKLFVTFDVQPLALKLSL